MKRALDSSDVVGDGGSGGNGVNPGANAGYTDAPTQLGPEFFKYMAGMLYTTREDVVADTQAAMNNLEVRLEKKFLQTVAKVRCLGGNQIAETALAVVAIVGPEIPLSPWPICSHIAAPGKWRRALAIGVRAREYTQMAS